MNELQNYAHNQNMNHQSLNRGAVAIEQSRAIAEAQGKLLLAKQFPRDENSAYTRLMMSCQRRGLAESAIYSFPRGGQTVSGPSIRLMEEIARLFGNVEYGIRELSSANGESEMEAYAWDLETNVVSSQKFKVRHERKANGRTTDLTDQRDVYELTANLGARRLRARLQAILPDDFIEAAVAACKVTLTSGNQEPLPVRVRQMLSEFSKISVTQDMIEARLGYSVDLSTEDDLVNLFGIYNSITKDQSQRSDWFEIEPAKKPESAAAVANNALAAASAIPAKQEHKPESAPTEAQAAEFKQRSEQIMMCETMEQLKNEYESAYRWAHGNFPAAIEHLTMAKDERKSQLEAVLVINSEEVK